MSFKVIEGGPRADADIVQFSNLAALHANLS